MRTLVLAISTVVLFAGAAGAQQASPTATEAQTDATTVQPENTAPMAGIPPAPRSGRNPLATRSEQNATTVQPNAAIRTGVDSPRSGVSPTAPESEQDATTVQQ